MKKLAVTKKLTLSRETIYQLQQESLAKVAGGASVHCASTECGNSGCLHSCTC